jgi:Na+/H+ antiporter NhaC
MNLYTLLHTFTAGTATIEVILELDSSESSTSGEFQVYRAGVSLIPLFLILILAMTTQMVELSLFTGIFVGACIVSGSLKVGFQDTLSKYLLDALADPDHVYVVLFTVFLSGTVGMMQKSGGMLGFTRDIARIATTPRSGQVACVSVGLLIFFDDYANCLLAGETMRPLLDLLSVSREKLSFIVDATSAPIASISP